jgi:hypothetical protein
LSNVPRLILALAVAAGTTQTRAGEWLQERRVGDYVIELRVAPRSQVIETPFVLAITRADGKPVATAKATGRANFSSAGLKGVATLHPDGENRMKGHGLMSESADMRIEVSMSLPGEASLEVIFAAGR